MDRSEYTISADLDPNNEIAPTDTINTKVVDTKISVTIPDASTIAAGDYIEFVVDQWSLQEGASLALEDGTIIGQLVKVAEDYAGYDVTLTNGYTKDSSELNQVTLDKPGFTNFVYRFVFNDTIKNYESVNFDYLSSARVDTAVGERVVDVTSTIKDTDGIVLDTEITKSTTYPLLPERPLTDNSDHVTSTFIYNVNSETAQGAFYFNPGISEETYDTLMRAGTTIDLNLFNSDLVSAKIRSIYPFDTPLTDSTISSFDNVEGFIGKNIHGVYVNTGTPVPYTITDLGDGKVRITLLEEVDLRTTQTLFWYDATLKALDETVIDPVTGQLRDGLVDWSYTITNPEGVVVEDRKVERTPIYVGAWSNADGTLTPKYNSTLNAVLEDGTVIK